MTMTLEQVLEVLRNACDEKHAIGSSLCGVLAAAIDAHLTQSASGDWDKVRKVITKLREGIYVPDAYSQGGVDDDCNDLADQLTAALPESKP